MLLIPKAEVLSVVIKNHQVHKKALGEITWHPRRETYEANFVTMETPTQVQTIKTYVDGSKIYHLIQGRPIQTKLAKKHL